MMKFVVMLSFEKYKETALPQKETNKQTKTTSRRGTLCYVRGRSGNCGHRERPAGKWEELPVTSDTGHLSRVFMKEVFTWWRRQGTFQEEQVQRTLGTAVKRSCHLRRNGKGWVWEDRLAQ